MLFDDFLHPIQYLALALSFKYPGCGRLPPKLLDDGPHFGDTFVIHSGAGTDLRFPALGYRREVLHRLGIFGPGGFGPNFVVAVGFGKE